MTLEDLKQAMYAAFGPLPDHQTPNELHYGTAIVIMDDDKKHVRINVREGSHQTRVAEFLVDPIYVEEDQIMGCVYYLVQDQLAV